MVTIGVDAHKEVHVAVALGESGQEVSSWRGRNDFDGWRTMYEWAMALGNDRRWGIEGAWCYGRGVAQHLVSAGEIVYDINARWTATGRRKARKPGKSDRLDAHAVALLTWREAGTLPEVFPEDDTSILQVLVTERENALAEATRLRNQIHAILLQVDPHYKSNLPNLQTRASLPALERYAPPNNGAVDQYRAAAIRRMAERLRLTLQQADDIAKQIKVLAHTRFTPLTRLCGINLLTAGTIAAILGPGDRFRNDAQLAAYAGVAPLEASSAGLARHRLNRGGNRRLNAVLYRIALTQARHMPEAQTYLARRTAEGKTRREAFRALKRYIVRAVWRLWQECPGRQEVSPIQMVA